MPSESIAFDRAAGYYDDTRRFPPGEDKKIAAFIVQAAGLNPTSRMLEIGVGTGRIALPLARHVARYYGADLSRPMMARLCEKQRGEPVYIAQADAARLPFPSQLFDAALGAHVFHLIAGWRDALDELARVLKPGAPLLHCWGGHDALAVKLHDAMSAVIPPDEQPQVGVRRENLPHFLDDERWQPVGEPHVYTYTYPRVPQEFEQRLEQRTFSGTWGLSDETLKRCVRAVQAVLDAEFPNPNEPIEVSATFNVGVYLPPA